jgi:tetratricopeptide (TPR) repeat protein
VVVLAAFRELARMSLVNKVVQDLNKRNATPEVLAGLDVRALPDKYEGHEGFWRAVVALMLVALACVGYLAYQLRPRPSLTTELAHQYVRGAVTQNRAVESPPPAPAATEVKTAQPESPSSGVTETVSPGVLKLARAIEAPIAARAGEAASALGNPVSIAGTPLRRFVPALQGGVDDAQLNHLLGVVLASLSRHEEAVQAYTVSLDRSPQNAASLVGLGVSLEALGKRQEALEAYRRALGASALEAPDRAFAERRVKEIQ